MTPDEIRRTLEADSHGVAWPDAVEADNLQREYIRQYARFWRLLREHAPNLAPAGIDLLLDCASLRARDIARLTQPTQPEEASKEA